MYRTFLAWTFNNPLVLEPTFTPLTLKHTHSIIFNQQATKRFFNEKINFLLFEQHKIPKFLIEFTALIQHTPTQKHKNTNKSHLCGNKFFDMKKKLFYFCCQNNTPLKCICKNVQSLKSWLSVFLMKTNPFKVPRSDFPI